MWWYIVSIAVALVAVLVGLTSLCRAQNNLHRD
jgi:hypothetical protein